MTSTRALTLLSCAFLGPLLAAAFVLPVRAAEQLSTDDAIAVLCEAWRVGEPDVLDEIEGITDRDPGAADAVRTALKDGGAQRIARILTPASFGRLVQFSDMRQIPQLFSETTSQGTTRSGISGFQEIGTRLELTPWNRGGNRIGLELDLRMTGTASTSDTDPVRSRTQTQIQTSLSAPLGVWRMFLSRTADRDLVVIFVRASAVDETPAGVDDSDSDSDSDQDQDQG